ncbi:endoplasmic reticulum aminopeptidase 1-like isoform X2 [Amphibalanus amphitrite]|uniref:endoplasmic reticulum aminopeptidase 1-like isoform X2 n=1 Tax=Amphibalanus amphitrite TaxID=1232801 RepID=UPI001C909B2B|nr:endoplasmic reticulum aminopeptidase 1-like isoform X2 [Amphibalanus amphitrite]
MWPVPVPPAAQPRRTAQREPAAAGGAVAARVSVDQDSSAEPLRNTDCSGGHSPRQRPAASRRPPAIPLTFEKDTALNLAEQLAADMSEVDDVAFLTGERALYNKAEYAGRKAVVCSPRRAAAVLVLVFLAVLAIALVAAFARPACLPSTGVVGPTTVAPPVATRPTTADGEPFPWDSLRLPPAVLPRRYELLLQPNLTTFAVVGRVKIQITVTQETSFIVLHSRNMTITKRELHTSDDSVNVSITRLLLYPERDQVYLSVNESLQLGQNYTLSFEFNYTLREALEGFYLSHYTAANGSKRYLATTQFEPNAARAAFPCFDEPQLKATFQLAMVRHESHTALFNTPRRSTADLDFYLGAGIKQDDFFETVRMSTYLVAFIVSDYAHISDTTDGNVLVSVWAPPHLVQQGQFAAQVAVSVLDFYTDYFGLPYQLPKLDLVAIPDFAAGAMENWGLCTFRLTSLLYEPSSGGSAIQQWVTRVVAHELAHQWFGNLVTMEWWNDLWLNEGFATLMEFIGAGHARPEYHMGQQFMLEATLTALALDSLRDSHPISVEVTDPDQIESIFDTISYSKGAAVLYMLMKELGQPVFKAGLNKYLRRHSLGSARTADLWAAVQEAAAEAETPPAGDGPPDVQAMMDSWTRQKSYPLISVVLSAGRLTVRQAPFTQLPAVGARQSDAPLWHVPLSCRLHRRAGLLAVRLNGTASVTVSAPRQSAWYYCNVNKTGVYRVTYPADNWAALQQLLLAGSSHLSVQDRAAIIDDAFSLNRADLLNASVPLRLSTSLSREAGLAPWAVSRRHLDWWLQLLYDQPTHAPLQHFVRRLIAPQYGQLGWSEQGSHVVRRLRALVLAWAVSVRLPEAVARARTLFSDWRNAGLPVPPDLRQLVYSTGVEYGDTGDWQFVWQRYLNATTPTEKNSLLRALGASTDPLILEHFLRISLAGELVRSQDFVLVVESTAANQAARLRLWRFVRLNWHKILDKFGGGTFMIDNIIQELVSRFSTQLELEEVRAFFDGKDLRSASRSLRQALESIQLNIRWRGSHQAAAAAWLEDWSRREAAGAAPPTARHWPN